MRPIMRCGPRLRPMRIVSLLPSTTEILFALGAGDDVVGVTFECDFPAEARSRTIVSTSAMPAGAGRRPRSTRSWSAAMARVARTSTTSTRARCPDSTPDLVVTQDLCAVCAVDVSVVDDALAHLGCTARGASPIDPHTLDDVLELDPGARSGRTGAARPPPRRWWRTSAHGWTVVRATRRRTSPGRRVMLLEWTDPPFSPGHWIPEMIEAAGGEPLLARPGADSMRTTWEAVREADPEVVVVAPCGFDRAGAQSLADGLVASDVLPPGVLLHAVDADAAWARPGTRLGGRRRGGRRRAPPPTTLSFRLLV